jgi:hypothetical protein
MNASPIANALTAECHMPEPKASTPWFSILIGAAALMTIVTGVVYLWLSAQAPASSNQLPQPSPTTLPNTSDKLAVSTTETHAWQVALANRKDCDSIQRYILNYPDGHFVAAAQAILGARRSVNETRWSAFEFPSNVVASSSLEARTSRDTACKSARAQLQQNMADGCSDFTRNSSKYRSVVVDPPSNASCECDDSAFHIGNSTTGVDSVWRCTIRSTYRCRGEQLERVTAFSCD